MKWLRSLAAELFPTWHERKVLRQLQADSEAGLDALQKYRRRLAMSDDKAPARDTRDTPAENPVTGDEANRPPPKEVPNTGEHVPDRKPDKAKDRR